MRFAMESGLTARRGVGSHGKQHAFLIETAIPTINFAVFGKMDASGRAVRSPAGSAKSAGVGDSFPQLKRTALASVGDAHDYSVWKRTRLSHDSRPQRPGI
jgi:hypothetical protein